MNDAPLQQQPGATPRITVVGAGMAGSEAALAAARLGVAVDLVEMRPKRLTPAHVSGDFAEMVCSNSFGGEAENNATGLLQAEMLAARGVIMRGAHANRVPAGGALAVDRHEFSRAVTADTDRVSARAIRSSAASPAGPPRTTSPSASARS